MIKKSNEPRKVRGRANLIDVYVGSRLREQRTILGFSQQRLGDALELTFQQIQKYESGANRVAASRLYQFSRVLGVSVSYFFEGLSQSDIPTNWSHVQNTPKTKLVRSTQPILSRETLELVRAYYQIKSAKQRKQIFDMVKTLGAKVPKLAVVNN